MTSVSPYLYKQDPSTERSMASLNSIFLIYRRFLPSYLFKLINKIIILDHLFVTKLKKSSNGSLMSLIISYFVCVIFGGRYIDFTIERKLLYKSIILIIYFDSLSVFNDIISLTMNQESRNCYVFSINHILKSIFN